MTEQLNSFSDFLKWETSTRDTIDVKCIYIDMALGDHVAGILLSQIVYWHLPSRRDDRTKLRVMKEGNLWLAKGREHWYAETRITSRQFDRASKILVDLGVIEKKIFKFYGNPTVHVRIIQGRFLELLQQHIEFAIADAIAGEHEDIEGHETFVSMCEDDGTRGEWQEVPVSASAYITNAPAPDADLEGVNSNSPNGENYNIERDLVSSSSLREDKDTLSPEPKSIKKCIRCGDNPAVAEKIDTAGRCALCLFVDAWQHYIGVRTPSYSTDNDRREYIGLDNTKTIQAKMAQRLRDSNFRQGWVFAMSRAGQMDYLKSVGWFKPEYFLRNGENWKKIVEGTFDSFEQQEHPASYARLQSWLARKRAGLAG